MIITLSPEATDGAADAGLIIGTNHPLAGNGLTFDLEVVGIGGTLNRAPAGCGCRCDCAQRR